MPALFPHWTNSLSRTMAGVALSVPAVAIAGLMFYVRSPLITGQHMPVDQPVQFDHRHHVVDDGLDCRYCHFTVESSPYAGMPAPSICMNCHAQVWNKSPLLEPIRQAYFTGAPFAWNRVHRLPQFVYFDHSIHVNKGVGCVTCHGRVDKMALTEQASTLNMNWCLDCHRNPGPNLRPRDAITQMDWAPPKDPRALAAELTQKYDVHTRTSCTTCHR